MSQLAEGNATHSAHIVENSDHTRKLEDIESGHSWIWIMAHWDEERDEWRVEEARLCKIQNSEDDP